MFGRNSLRRLRLQLRHSCSKQASIEYSKGTINSYCFSYIVDRNHTINLKQLYKRTVLRYYGRELHKKFLLWNEDFEKLYKLKSYRSNFLIVGLMNNACEVCWTSTESRKSYGSVCKKKRDKFHLLMNDFEVINVLLLSVLSGPWLSDDYVIYKLAWHDESHADVFEQILSISLA